MKQIHYCLDPHIYHSEKKKNIVPKRTSVFVSNPKDNKAVEIRIDNGLLTLTDNEDGTFEVRGPLGHPLRLAFDPRPMMQRSQLFAFMREVTAEEAESRAASNAKASQARKPALVSVLSVNNVNRTPEEMLNDFADDVPPTTLSEDLFAAPAPTGLVPAKPFESPKPGKRGAPKKAK